MARRAIVLTGDKRLTRMLNSLGGKKAVEISRKATKAGAKLVLDVAKGRVPVRSGKFRRSLTVRALKRSRKGVGFRVTQREINQQGKKKKVFYGSFLELGFTHRGRPREDGDDSKQKKIPARWIMRQSGKDAEDKAVELYRSEIERMIEEA